MKSYGILGLTALLSTSVTAAAAAAAATTTANACTKDPYKALLPLSKYAVAESFCSSKYPLSTVTSTSTVTVTAGSNKRRGSSTSAKPSTTTPAKSTTSSACTGDCATWSSCTKKGGDFLSTLCSCIETQKTTTVTKTSTVTRTTTSASPTFTCPPRDLTGPPRCNCYYSTFCNTRYTGPANASTTVSSYDACITFAGNVKTGRADPADLTYFPKTGLCQAFIFPQGSATDPDAVVGSAVYNAENCYLQDIQDLNMNGCGCVYAEDCDMGYDGDVYADLGGLGVADCDQACDYAGSACVGFTNSGGSHCILYGSITDKYRSFGQTSYYRTSCANPCVKS